MRATLSMSVGEFCRSVKTNRVFAQLEHAFFAATGRSVGPAERASWQGSLPRLSGAIELARLPDATFIGLEVNIPYYSERIDAVLYGHDADGKSFVVLIELKQWSDAGLVDDGRLSISMRSGPVQVTHPSFQVNGYRQHLKNFVRALHNQPAVHVACCVYAHNYPGRGGPLFHPQYADVMAQAPVFSAMDAEALADYMKGRLGDDRGLEIVDRVRREGLAPSKQLIEYASEMIRRQDVFTMLDEQIPAQQSIVRSISKAIQRNHKSIVLVNGGPGTGKSVIALDALGHALRKDLTTYLVSGSAAFTHGMRRLLGPDLTPLVRFTDFFWDHPENSVDVMIVDEAHRIRTKSQPKVVAARRPKIAQLEEIVRAAKVTVLFMDANQIIQPDESGDPEQVAALAARLGIELIPHHLRAQFRCDGSDEYLRWADDIFDLALIEDPRTLRSPQTFDLDIMDSPHDVLAWVRDKNAAAPNSARLTAGWCWPWSDPLPDGSLVNDIVIGDFTFPWELKNGKRGKPGIPQAKHWAVDPAGADQTGTVYSVQGFEFHHVGVLMGPDLVIRDGRWVANPRANFASGLRAKPPDVASVYLRRIYRALFTRPLRSLRVHSVDPETRSFLRSRVERNVQPLLAAAAREVGLEISLEGAKVLPFRRIVPKLDERYKTCVPLIGLRAAAGVFGEPQESLPEIGGDHEWVAWDTNRRFTEDMFVARVHGRSMEPRIPDGAYCLFRRVPAAPPGQVPVLVRYAGEADPETGGQYTIKLWREDPPGGVTQRISLIPVNRSFSPLVFTGAPEGAVRVIAEVVEVLGVPGD